MYVCSVNAIGQIPPVTPEYVFPSMFTSGAPVYTPRYTSAYSYSGVDFQLSTSIIKQEKIDGTDSMSVAPDVALGNNGNTVYVSYMKAGSVPNLGDVLVERATFASVYGATAPIIFTNEYTESDASKIYDNSDLNNHIRIDAPDSLYANLWTIAYLKDFNQLNTVTVDPYTFTPNLMSGILSGTLHNFCSPAIAYASSADHISLAWYDLEHRMYFGTRLNVQGTNYEAPASASTYYIINLKQNFTDHCFNGGKIAFSTSQQKNAQNLFMAFTTSENPTTPWISNMITKLSPWIVTSPYSKQVVEEEVHLQVAPNPITSNTALISNKADMNIQQLLITDVLGKAILKLNNSNIDIVNQHLQVLIPKLSSGIYSISVITETNNFQFKVVKN